jgi:hypothetical protein
VTIARAQELDELVTDSALDAETVDEYRAAGVRLVVAPAQ